MHWPELLLARSYWVRLHAAWSRAGQISPRELLPLPLLERTFCFRFWRESWRLPVVFLRLSTWRPSCFPSSPWLYQSWRLRWLTWRSSYFPLSSLAVSDVAASVVALVDFLLFFLEVVVSVVAAEFVDWALMELGSFFREDAKVEPTRTNPARMGVSVVRNNFRRSIMVSPEMH